MLSIYQLKPKFQQLLRPLVKNLFMRNITANQVTIAACVGSLIIAAIISVAASSLWVFCLMPIWMLLRMALNAIDGMLAREFHQQSTLGAYLNELCDVIADSALILIFAFLPSVNIFLLILVIVLSILTEYAGVMGPLVGSPRRYDGPMGKSDRAFVFGLLSATVAFNWLPLSWLNIVFIIISLLLIYTVINRVRFGLKAVALQSKGGEDAPTTTK